MTLAPERAPRSRPTRPAGDLPTRRARLFAVLTFIALVVLVGRLFQIQARGDRRATTRAALPGLRLLASPPRSARGPTFITSCVGVLVACLLVLLLLNIGLARGAYHEKQLVQQQTALMEQEQEQEQTLREGVSEEGSPSALVEKARELGMIENPTPAFIQLSDGTVLGEPRPAQAPAQDYAPASLTRKAPAPGAGQVPGGAVPVGGSR